MDSTNPRLRYANGYLANDFDIPKMTLNLRQRLCTVDILEL